MRLIIVEGGGMRLQTWNRRAPSSDKCDLIGQADGPLGDDIQQLTDLNVLPEARLSAPGPFGQDAFLDLRNFSFRPCVGKLGRGGHAVPPLSRGRAPLEVDDLPADGGDRFAALVGISVREAIGHRPAGERARRGPVKAVICAGSGNGVSPVDGPIEGQLRRRMKGSESRPAELDAEKKPMTKDGGGTGAPRGD